MSKGPWPFRIAMVALVAMTGLSLVLGFALLAAYWDRETLGDLQNEKSAVYGELVSEACSSRAQWIEAYAKQGIAVRFRDFNGEYELVGKDMSRVKSVLERPDRTTDKFGGDLAFFDENGWLVNL